MAASGSGSGLAGLGSEKKDDGLAHGLDKTMDGVSLDSIEEEIEK